MTEQPAGRMPGDTATRPVIGVGGPLVPDVRRIAVLRGGGLGDLVFALPALDALRATYPEAEIVLAGAPWTAGFLAGRPGPVDRVVPLPMIPGVYEPADVAEDAEDTEAFVAAMRDERFDLAIQIHGGGRFSNPLVRRFAARVSAGLRSPEALPLDRNVHYSYYQSEVMRDLEVVGLVGARPVGVEPRLEAAQRDLEEAASAIPRGSAPIAILHPGAGDPRRRWPVESFAAVGEALAAAGARVVVTGAAQEADLTRSTSDLIGAAATDVGGLLSLGGLVGLLSRAAVVVSNDSGPLHLAAAVGAPTVGIYWCGNLINAGPFSRGRHRPVVSWRLGCPVCGVDCTKDRCGHTDSFVAEAPVDEVRDAAVALMAEAVASRRSARGHRSALRIRAAAR